jgi:hypothetical protein
MVLVAENRRYLSGFTAEDGRLMKLREFFSSQRTKQFLSHGFPL